MSDLRALLRDGAGDPPPFDFAHVSERARRLRRRRRATALSALGAIATLLVAVPALVDGTDGGVRTVDPVGGLEERDRQPQSDLDRPDARDPGVAPRRPDARSSVQQPPAAGGHDAEPTVGSEPLDHADRMAFTRGSGIYAANSDGSGLVRLVRDAHSPAWSPDGRRLAFVLLRDPTDPNNRDSARTRGHLAVIDADGRNVSVIRDNAGPANGFSVDAPAWSPDGSRLAFVQRYCGGVDAANATGDDQCRPGAQDESLTPPRSEIRSIRLDGSGERLLIAGADWFNESPTWSPDGKRIAFARWLNASDRGGDLFIMNRDGTGRVNFTNQPGGNYDEPAWSPDGRWIAFTNRPAEGVGNSCGTSHSVISVISIDKSIHPRLTDGGGGCDSEPAWSSDSASLLFTRRTSDARFTGQVWSLSSIDTYGSFSVITTGVQPAQRPTVR